MYNSVLDCLVRRRSAPGREEATLFTGEPRSGSAGSTARVQRGDGDGP